MPKYRKKPVEIEAKQFKRKNIIELAEWTNGNLHNIVIPKCIGGIMTGQVKTLEGIMVATEKDYIIKGVNGEFYPCKPDIFHKTYEKVE